jgi:hypothetical protein
VSSCPISFGMVLKNAHCKTLSRTGFSLALSGLCDPGQHFSQFFLFRIPTDQMALKLGLGLGGFSGHIFVVLHPILSK